MSYLWVTPFLPSPFSSSLAMASGGGIIHLLSRTLLQSFGCRLSLLQPVVRTPRLFIIPKSWPSLKTPPLISSSLMVMSFLVLLWNSRIHFLGSFLASHPHLTRWRLLWSPNGRTTPSSDFWSPKWFSSDSMSISFCDAKPSYWRPLVTQWHNSPTLSLATVLWTCIRQAHLCYHMGPTME